MTVPAAAPGSPSAPEPTASALAAAQRATADQAAAVASLADALTPGTAFAERFAAAIDRLAATQGRVIVTGIGKSGHVARKLAATLASTGTPAFFLHATEASHGDLGMVCSGDTLLALSNSGNTAELSDALLYTRRWGIPLIGITGRADSMLAEQSDIVMVLPPHSEACPMNLAPTTSTTLQLVLGDALAIALMDRRGFSPDDFRALHPGGSLGARLIRVADLMLSGTQCPTVPIGTAMADAIVEMSAKGWGIIGVVDADGRLAGVVTDGDLRRHIHEGDILSKPVDAVMSTRPKTIRPGALAAEALRTMNEMAITSLFVEDGNRHVKGLIRMHDCLRAGVG